MTTDKCAPHVRRWNGVVTLSWQGGKLVEITQEAPDGTIASTTIAWSGDRLSSIGRYSV